MVLRIEHPNPHIVSLANNIDDRNISSDIQIVVRIQKVTESSQNELSDLQENHDSTEHSIHDHHVHVFGVKHDRDRQKNELNGVHECIEEHLVPVVVPEGVHVVRRFGDLEVVILTFGDDFEELIATLATEGEVYLSAKSVNKYLHFIFVINITIDCLFDHFRSEDLILTYQNPLFDLPFDRQVHVSDLSKDNLASGQGLFHLITLVALKNQSYSFPVVEITFAIDDLLKANIDHISVVRLVTDLNKCVLVGAHQHVKVGAESPEGICIAHH